jgi:hypothetical protein
LAELESGAEPLGRVRRPGGGRKRAADLDPGLRPALLALAEPDMRGDPMSPLRWTVKSTRALAAELARQGHRVSADTVADLLHEEDFSLQGNAKTLEGRQHPDRDAQFRYNHDQVKAHQGSGDPVVSGHHEEGTGRGIQERRPGMAPEGRAGEGQHPRLPPPRAGQGHPLAAVQNALLRLSAAGRPSGS